MPRLLASPNSDVLELGALRPQHQPPQILLLGLAASLALHGGILLGLRSLWTRLKIDEVTDLAAIEVVQVGAIDRVEDTPAQPAKRSTQSQAAAPQASSSSASPLPQAAPAPVQPAAPTRVAPEPALQLAPPPRPALPAQPQPQPTVTAAPAAAGRDRPTQLPQPSPSAAPSPTASSPPQPSPLPAPSASSSPGVGQPSPDATAAGGGTSWGGGVAESGQPLPPTSASVRSSLGQFKLMSQVELGAPATLIPKEPSLTVQQLPFPLVAGQTLSARVSLIIDNRTGALVRLQEPGRGPVSPKVLPESPAIRQGLISQDNLQSLVTRLLESYQFQVKIESSAAFPAPSSQWVGTLEITAF